MNTATIPLTPAARPETDAGAHDETVVIGTDDAHSAELAMHS